MKNFNLSLSFSDYKLIMFRKFLLWQITRAGASLSKDCVDYSYSDKGQYTITFDSVEQSYNFGYEWAMYQAERDYKMELLPLSARVEKYS